MVAALLLALAMPVAAANTYTVQHVNNNLCLDNTNGKVVDGNRVQVWTCYNNANQLWDFTPGKYPTTIQLHGTNFCLTANPPSDGASLVIQTCNGEYSQVWSGPQNNKICLLGTNYCIDLTNGAAVDGTLLQTWTYYQDNVNQQWTWNPVQTCAV